MKNFPLLFLFLVFWLNLQSQVAVKFFDNKLISTEGKISALEKDTNGSVQQFSDDNFQDIETFVAVNPTDANNIIVSWIWLDPQGQNHPVVRFKMFYTLDGGNTWNETNYENFLPADISSTHVITGGGDPVIVFDNNGVAYFSWIYAMLRFYTMDSMYVEFILHYAYSDDGGATWIRPQNDTIEWGRFRYSLSKGIEYIDSMYPPDKQWMVINPLTNDLIVSYTAFWDLDSLNRLWGIKIKPADADTFGQRILVPPDTFLVCTHGSITADKQGNIYAFYPFYPDTSKAIERLALQKSQDGGFTWSQPVFISDVSVENFTAAGQTNSTNTKAYDRLTTNFYAAVDTSESRYSGRIYAVWNGGDTNYFSKIDVYFSYSDDGGQTWHTNILNSDPPRDYGLHHRPTITVNPDGKVIVAWYDNRNAQIPYVYNTDYYLAISNDGGQTFEQYKISDTVFDYNAINSSFYVGEYNQVAANKDFVYLFWGALEPSKHDVEIYYAKCDINNPLLVEFKPLNTSLNFEPYPNPFENTLNLKVFARVKQSVYYQLFTQDGKSVKKGNFVVSPETASVEIQAEDLPAGVYILVLNTREGNFGFKVLKKN